MGDNGKRRGGVNAEDKILRTIWNGVRICRI